MKTVGEQGGNKRISWDGELRPLSNLSYHRYLTKKYNSRIAPYATKQIAEDSQESDDDEVFVPKCKRLNDFMASVKSGSNKFKDEQRKRFIKEDHELMAKLEVTHPEKHLWKYTQHKTDHVEEEDSTESTNQ